jgi:predicted AlkP superfamily phosphohydrolase/phosphomutase
LTAAFRENPLLLVFALDSANLDLLERWIADGRLPNIAQLWKSGRTAAMGGRAYFDEAGTWLSAYSGLPSTVHGYYASRHIVPGTYDVRLRRLESSNALPFWSNLPDHFRTLVLEPVEGFVVSGSPGDQVFNLTAHQEAYSAAEFQAVPNELRQEVLRVFGPPPALEFNRFHEPLGYYKRQAKLYHDILARKGKLFEHLFRRGDYDVVIAGFNELHDCGHVLWHFFEGRGDSRDPKGELSGELQRLYEAVDREVGRLLAAAPAGTTVCLLSTYGLKDQYPTLELTEKLMTGFGFTTLRKFEPKGFSAVRIARRLVPEPVRFALSKHLPVKLQQNLVASRFSESIDWQNTRAVVIPSSLFSGHIRVNLKGREPNGIVEPGAQYNAVLDEIESEFRKVVDPRTGAPVVAVALRSAGVHSEGPNWWLPDMYIHWQRSRHFLDRVIHPKLGELSQRQSEFHRSSYHQRPGFVSISGPGIEPARLENEIDLEDIAPTLRSSLGLAGPAGVGTSFLAAAPDPAM